MNLRMEHFAEKAKEYKEEMIIVAPQPGDWGETSKRQTIGMTEYMLAAYNIDPEQVYISGYSGGGETLSLAVYVLVKLTPVPVTPLFMGKVLRLMSARSRYTYTSELTSTATSRPL